MLRSEDKHSLKELLLFFHMGSEDGTQVTKAYKASAFTTEPALQLGVIHFKGYN